mmetsp:Transcript_4501/g.28630  ORF Transcript_4501/g.28630 Transcript_4501/m.28630 type:complete len:119 (-) Transcript_4501:662-1018(-)
MCIRLFRGKMPHCRLRGCDNHPLAFLENKPVYTGVEAPMLSGEPLDVEYTSLEVEGVVAEEGWAFFGVSLTTTVPSCRADSQNAFASILMSFVERDRTLPASSCRATKSSYASDSALV